MERYNPRHDLAVRGDFISIKRKVVPASIRRTPTCAASRSASAAAGDHRCSMIGSFSFFVHPRRTSRVSNSTCRYPLDTSLCLSVPAHADRPVKVEGRSPGWLSSPFDDALRTVKLSSSPGGFVFGISCYLRQRRGSVLRGKMALCSSMRLFKHRIGCALDWATRMISRGRSSEDRSLC